MFCIVLVGVSRAKDRHKTSIQQASDGCTIAFHNGTRQLRKSIGEFANLVG